MDDERDTDNTRETSDEGASSGSSSGVEIEAVEPDMMCAKKKKKKATCKNKQNPIDILDRASPPYI